MTTRAEIEAALANLAGPCDETYAPAVQHIELNAVEWLRHLLAELLERDELLREAETILSVVEKHFEDRAVVPGAARLVLRPTIDRIRAALERGGK